MTESECDGARSILLGSKAKGLAWPRQGDPRPAHRNRQECEENLPTPSRKARRKKQERVQSTKEVHPKLTSGFQVGEALLEAPREVPHIFAQSKGGNA